MGEWCNPIMSKGTTTKITNTNHRQKIKKEEEL
jgi:hypothetical protein